MSALSKRPGFRTSRAPTARELLHAMLEHAHVDGFARDGSVRLTWSVPAEIFAALQAWEADALEDDEIDEAASEQRFFGSGCGG